MRIVLFLFLVFSFASSHAQYPQQPRKPFTVRYVSGYLTREDSLDIAAFIKNHPFHPVVNYELVVTDTAAYIHLYEKERERNENPLGSRFRPHNIYIDFIQQKEYRQSQPLNERRYQVETLYQARQFDLFKDSVTILGYTCYKAVPVNKVQGNETHYWYAPDLPYPVSMYGFTGLPGLVLATERWSHHIRSVSIAERIEAEKRTLVRPYKGTHIDAASFESLLSGQY